jgi:hypothetical protein
VVRYSFVPGHWLPIDPGADENSALRLAVEKGYIDFVKLLLEQPKVNPLIKIDETIRIAGENGHARILDLLRGYKENAARLASITTAASVSPPNSSGLPISATVIGSEQPSANTIDPQQSSSDDIESEQSTLKRKRFNLRFVLNRVEPDDTVVQVAEEKDHLASSEKENASMTPSVSDSKAEISADPVPSESSQTPPAIVVSPAKKRRLNLHFTVKR